MTEPTNNTGDDVAANTANPYSAANLAAAAAARREEEEERLQNDHRYRRWLLKKQWAERATGATTFASAQPNSHSKPAIKVVKRLKIGLKTLIH